MIYLRNPTSEYPAKGDTTNTFTAHPNDKEVCALLILFVLVNNDWANDDNAALTINIYIYEKIH